MDVSVVRGLSKTQLKAQAQSLLEKWQPLLGLQNWRIEVQVIKLEGSAMRINWSPGYLKALLTVSLDPENKELSQRSDIFEADVVHELLHLSLAPVRDFMHREFEANGTFWPLYANAQETVVDNLTTVMLRKFA